jgi:hypothetical protein
MHVCSNCRRHVRERECPFCHAAPVETDSAPAPLVSRDGLRRGALVASVFAMTACAPTVTPAYGVPVDSGSDAVSASDAADDAPVAAYGIPPQDAGQEDVNVMPPYGVPPEDAGTE